MATSDWARGVLPELKCLSFHFVATLMSVAVENGGTANLIYMSVRFLAFHQRTKHRETKEKILVDSVIIQFTRL